MMRNKKVITLIMILAVTMLVGCSEAKDSGTNDIETKEQEGPLMVMYPRPSLILTRTVLPLAAQMYPCAMRSDS